MTSEIALRDSAPPAYENDLTEWAYSARQAHGIATSLAATEFVPSALRNRPDSVCAAILTGRELGLSPMASLNAIDIVDGRPSMRAMAMRAIVQSLGHRIWVEESTDTRAVVCGQRKRAGLLGGGVEPVERSVWTFDRAKKAGLTGKRNWQNYPAAMLIARATAEVCRLVAADALLGMPYAVEELEDGDANAPVQGPAEPPRTKPARRTAQRAAIVDVPLPGSDAAPPLQDAPETRTEPADESQQQRREMTDPQRRKMHACFRDLGITDREQRLAIVRRIVGRDLASSAELDVFEAAAVIDALELQLGNAHIEPEFDDDNRDGPDAPAVPQND